MEENLKRYKDMSEQQMQVRKKDNVMVINNSQSHIKYYAFNNRNRKKKTGRKQQPEATTKNPTFAINSNQKWQNKHYDNKQQPEATKTL